MYIGIKVWWTFSGPRVQSSHKQIVIKKHWFLFVPLVDWSCCCLVYSRHNVSHKVFTDGWFSKWLAGRRGGSGGYRLLTAKLQFSQNFEISLISLNVFNVRNHEKLVWVFVPFMSDVGTLVVIKILGTFKLYTAAVLGQQKKEGWFFFKENFVARLLTEKLKKKSLTT